LRDDLKSSNILILTLGNTLEWNHTFVDNEINIDYATVLKCYHSKDTMISKNVRAAGTLRLQAPFRIVKNSIKLSISCIRELFDGHIFITISPIPINGFTDLKGNTSCSAVVENSISKSTLRAALHEVLQENKIDSRLYYFPSYEISTDVQSRIPNIGFGSDDSVARHVDNFVIKKICEFFTWKIIG
jgi:hypothetical protein